MMKKFVALLLAACLLCPVFAFAEETIKLGIFEPMTGATAAGGAMEQEGLFTRYLAVNDGGILADVDTPRDYETLLAVRK